MTRSLPWLSLLSLIFAPALLTGCAAEPAGEEYADVEEGAPDDEAAHDHGHATGPNGGHIIEFAEDHSIHGEFVLADGIATLYLTGSDMSTPVEADEVVFDIESEDADGNEVEEEVPMVSTGEAGVYASAEGAIAVDDVEELHGHFHIVVEGEDYEGELGHDHDHEGHDHGDHEGHDHGDHEGHDHGDHEGHDHDHGEEGEEA